MNKMIGLLLATLLVLGVGPDALSSDAPALPPGVSAENWISLGDRAGFVLTNGDSLIGSVTSVGVAKGYFMLRRAGVWLRIESVQDAGGAGRISNAHDSLGGGPPAGRF
jgi:hypothetical protein